MSGITSTIAIMYAVEIHVISWMLAPSSPRMFGIATLTIDESIVAISEPSPIADRDHPLVDGCVRARQMTRDRAHRLAIPFRNVSTSNGAAGGSGSSRSMRAWSIALNAP